MAFEMEQRQAMHLLEGIENGTMSSSQLSNHIDEADPALVYLTVSWLRSRYGADHPAAGGVIGRIVELTKGAGSMNKKMNEGKTDPISTWFEEEFSYRDYSAKDFIALIVEKLES